MSSLERDDAPSEGPAGGDQDRFRVLVEGTSDFIWEVDASGRYTYASPRVRDLLGYEPQELLGRTPFELMPPGEAERVEQAFMAHRAARRAFAGLVNVNLHKEGYRVVLETSAVPVVDERGVLRGYRGIDRDITQRRIAEEEVRYRLAFEQVITGLSSRFVNVDPLAIDREIDGALDVLGSFADVDRCYVFLFREGDLMDNTHEWCSMGISSEREWLQSLRVADYPSVAEGVRRGEVVHISRVSELPDGPERIEFDRERIQSLLLVPITCSGEVTGFLGMDSVRTVRTWPVEIISLLRIVGEILGSAFQRRRVESALRRENALRDAIIARLGEGLCVARLLPTQPFVRFTVWNERMTEITGVGMQEVNRRGWLRVLFRDPAARRSAVARLARALEGDDLECEEWPLSRADGQRRRLTLSTTLLDQVDGERHLLALVQDVTERRALEERLSQVQKLEAIGTLAGGIAHDFNNLLAVIIGHTELLQGRLDARSDACRDLEHVRGAAHRAAELTRQLLAFGRKQVLAQQLLDLNGVVTDVERMLRRVLGEDVSLRVELSPELGCVRADPSQLGQVLMNLVVNARDAMPHGGELTIRTAHARPHDLSWLDASEITGRGFVMFSVADTGVGMDAKTKSRIFEPFFTTKELGRGTGLGLSTVYGIVKQSGGHITCDSELGHGSVFKVFLPRVDGVPPARRPTEDHVPARSGAETVLICEDDADVRDLVAKILRQAGYTVLTASSGEAALATALGYAGDIALLLTDVVMPKVGGPELARRIRMNRPGLKVLFMSGYTRGAVGRDVDVPFIQKPFAATTLLARVRESIEG